MPEAARDRSDAGIKAFVSFYFDQVNDAWTKPQGGLVKVFSDAECKFCAKIDDTAVYLQDKGQRYATDPSELVSAQPFGGAPEGEQFVEIVLVQKKANILDAAGSVIHTDPANENSYYATLRWRDGAWSMLEVERTK